MVESKKVKETEEEKEKLVKKVVEELLKEDGSEKSPKGPNPKPIGNGLNTETRSELVGGGSGGCP